MQEVEEKVVEDNKRYIGGVTGTANTGGGAGGSGPGDGCNTGGVGGSGIVIIRYKFQ